MRSLFEDKRTYLSGKLEKEEERGRDEERDLQRLHTLDRLLLSITDDSENLESGAMR